MRLNTTQKNILDVIRKNEGITLKEICEKSECKERTVGYTLKILLALQVIETRHNWKDMRQLQYWICPGALCEVRS